MITEIKVEPIVTVIGILFITKTLSTVKIENMTVPELVQSGSSAVVLDCQYTISTDIDIYTIQWFFNNNKSPFYEWTPPKAPKFETIHEGRYNSSIKISSVSTREHTGLSLQQVTTELSGDYTCRVLTDDKEDKMKKSMLVYSPETDFELKVDMHQYNFDIKCIANGLYPQPELTLEHNINIIPTQMQRSWRNEQLYNAESSVTLRRVTICNNPEITCRLHLPQADYTSIRKKYIIGKKKCNASTAIIPYKIYMIFILPITANYIL